MLALSARIVEIASRRKVSSRSAQRSSICAFELMTVSGVLSSCDASAMSRRSRVLNFARSRRANGAVAAAPNVVRQSEMVNARVRDLEFGMDEREGRPSHWNTLRAMRVLDWYERGR